MPIAFLIMAHRNPAQLAALFHAIHRPDDLIYLHIDRRAPGVLHRLAHELARSHPNVRVLRPLRIVWGGFAAAEVQLRAMTAALRDGHRWHHFINLSGQDFPVKRLEQLDAHLQAAPGANYVSWFDPLDEPLWRNARERLDRYYLEWPWLDRLFRVRGGWRLRRLLGCPHGLPYLPWYRRRWPGFRYYGGSNYVVLSRAACAYVVGDPAARRITRWLRHTLHPDEILMQSVLLNSPFAPTVLNTSLHAIDFPPGSPHPRVFRERDFDELLASPMFFARKFDAGTDARILARLSRHLELSCSCPP